MKMFTQVRLGNSYCVRVQLGTIHINQLRPVMAVKARRKHKQRESIYRNV